MIESRKRIYTDKVDINSDSIRDFYDRRAMAFLSGTKSSNTTVLLGDNNPEYADKWDEFEKNIILPRLKLDQEKNVLDIGCGIGRWAETVIPICGNYLGVDFSGEMVKAASKRFDNMINATFRQGAFLDIFKMDDVKGYKFDAVIIAGVSMYINDQVLAQCYGELSTILNNGAIVYIEESIGVEKRLTLNNIWSENLNSDYHAIYRTREEYKKILTPLLKQTKVLADDYFNALDKKELSETSHWYTLLEMK